MRPRTEIPTCGIWPALRVIAGKVVKKHPEQISALLAQYGPMTRSNQATGQSRPCSDEERLDNCLELLATLAAEPGDKTTKAITPPEYLHACFVAAPDFTIELMSTIRKWWHKPTKARRFQRFLMLNTAVKEEEQSQPVYAWEMQHGPLARAFENSPDGEPISIRVVEEARLELARLIADGEETPLL